MNIQYKGIKIVDSKRDLKVRIKPQDIEGAICKDHQKCAIARALLRQTGARWVDVGASRALVSFNKKSAMRFILNEMAKEQVRYFDTHRASMAPCKVQLYAVPPSLRKGYRSGIKAHSGPSGKRKHRTPPTR